MSPRVAALFVALLVLGCNTESPNGAGGSETTTGTTSSFSTASTSTTLPVVCIPGEHAATPCVCPNGTQGATICNDDGTGYGSCMGCNATPPASCSYSSQCDGLVCKGSETGVCGFIGSCVCSGPIYTVQMCPNDIASIPCASDWWDYTVVCGGTAPPASDCFDAPNGSALHSWCCPMHDGGI